MIISLTCMKPELPAGFKYFFTLMLDAYCLCVAGVSIANNI